MSLGIDFPAFSGGNPFTGTTPASSIDTFNSALENNGALQLLGSLYCAPLNPATVGTAANGSGLQPIYKYVRYNPTASQTILGGPGIVYWKDETFTVVTPTLSEALGGAAGSNSVAGWLLYNTASVTGATAATINGNFCWIQVGGFLPAASVVTGTAIGDALIGATGSFINARIANHAALTNDRIAAYALTAIAGGFADLNIPLIN